MFINQPDKAGKMYYSESSPVLAYVDLGAQVTNRQVLGAPESESFFADI
jgi:hypothetical protein